MGSFITELPGYFMQLSLFFYSLYLLFFQNNWAEKEIRELE